MTLLRISGNQSILPYFLCYTLLLVQSCKLHFTSTIGVLPPQSRNNFDLSFAPFGIAQDTPVSDNLE